MTSTSPELEYSELTRAARTAMEVRSLDEAERLLRLALRLRPDDVTAILNIAGCRRARGDLAGALELTDKALSFDARAFPALLMRASVLEQLGRTREAGAAYGVAVSMAPSADQLEPTIRRALAKGQERHASHVKAASEYLDDRLIAFAAGDAATVRRARNSVKHFLRTRKRYVQDPVQFYYPGLPSVEFYEREEFPWLEALEAKTDEITVELLGILDGGQSRPEPYINYSVGVPLDQWGPLNGSLDWSAFHLSRNGASEAHNAARCPKTMAALADLPQPHIPLRSPASMFSLLKPGVRLPPHTGVSNTRLVAHLPLIVPHGCAFRVGNETREWARGIGWVFDDTIEHEAWNDSGEMRAILIFDIWSPRLSADDRLLITELMVAIDDFNGGAQGDPGL